MAKPLNIDLLVGKKLNSLTLIKEDTPHITSGGYKHRVCLFLCDCGNYKKIRVSSFLNQTTKSCGCHSKKMASNRMKSINKKHGGYNTPEYNSWLSMRKRCNNEKHKSYNDYGGRGITVCEEWNKSFKSFINDMGYRPSKKHSLDRIDNNKGYYKSNCRWANKKTQTRNQRSNVFVEAFNKRKCVSEWAEILGWSSQKLNYRLFISKNKYSLESILKQEGILNSI